MAKCPAYHLQPHVPIEASGNMTDWSIHPLWLTLNFLLMQQKKKKKKKKKNG